MFEKYIFNLYKQFCRAVCKNFSPDDVFADRDFIEWIESNKIVMNEY